MRWTANPVPIGSSAVARSFDEGPSASTDVRFASGADEDDAATFAPGHGGTAPGFAVPFDARPVSRDASLPVPIHRGGLLAWTAGASVARSRLDRASAAWAAYTASTAHTAFRRRGDAPAMDASQAFPHASIGARPTASLDGAPRSAGVGSGFGFGFALDVHATESPMPLVRRASVPASVGEGVPWGIGDEPLPVMKRRDLAGPIERPGIQMAQPAAPQSAAAVQIGEGKGAQEGGKVDLDDLAELTLKRVMRLLSIERERSGAARWPS